MSESYLAAGAIRHSDFVSLLGREPVPAPPVPKTIAPDPQPRLHTFSFSSDEKNESLHVLLLLLGETLYIWVGDDEARLEALSVAVPSPGTRGSRPSTAAGCKIVGPKSRRAQHLR